MSEMIKRIKENAKKEWLSEDDYYKLREERKNRVINKIRKRWDLKISSWINKIKNYQDIKGWFIEIGWGEVTIKAYVTSLWRKPIFLWDMDRMTFVEKNKVRRTVYWYFDNLQKAD